MQRRRFLVLCLRYLNALAYACLEYGTLDLNDPPELHYAAIHRRDHQCSLRIQDGHREMFEIPS